LIYWGNKIEIKIYCNKNIKEEAFIQRRCTSMYSGGSSWGQKELTTLFANNKYSVDISKKIIV